jgi:Fur family transcriptional regulator, ferric uptake regulator
VAPNPLIESLDRAGYRLTQPRRAIADLIAERPGHFSAEDLLTTSRQRRLGLGRATVFRSLDLLEELGQIERLDLPSGDHAFVACERAHHHHVVCGTCGTAADVPDAGIGELVDEIAAESGYRIDRHRLELFGTCPRCLRAGKAPDGTT